MSPPHEMTLCTGIYGELPFWDLVKPHILSPPHFEKSGYAPGTPAGLAGQCTTSRKSETVDNTVLSGKIHSKMSVEVNFSLRREWNIVIKITALILFRVVFHPSFNALNEWKFIHLHLESTHFCSYPLKQHQIIGLRIKGNACLTYDGMVPYLFMSSEKKNVKW